jgi:hypothetical protein
VHRQRRRRRLGFFNELPGPVQEAMAGSTVLTEEAAKAQEEWLKTVSTALQGFSDPLDTYKGLLEEKTAADRESAEKQAAASKDSSDSWKDFVTDVSVSLDEYAAKLEEQMTAQANWRTNIVKVTGWAGEEVGQILLGMGEGGCRPGRARWRTAPQPRRSAWPGT